MRKTTESRLEYIQSYLLEHKSVRVMQLSSQLEVTPEMIRRDLTFLEEKGFLFRTHGGAILRESNVDVPLFVRSKEKVDIKRRLCFAALQLIENDDVIFVDPSSTYLHLGQLLKLKKNLVIVTNCFDFMDNAKDCNHEMYFLGGKYSKTGKRTEGQFQIPMVDKFSFDISFFGMDGFIGDYGAGTQSQDAVFLNTQVMKISKKNVLMIDSSKFEMTSRYCYADLSEFDVLITDRVPEEWREKLKCKTIIELDEIQIGE